MQEITYEIMLKLYRHVMEKSGGSYGVRDEGTLKSALAQPHTTFDGEELYPTLEEKAGALGYSIIQNHPFVDGNKRAGHAAVLLLLAIRGYRIRASVDEQERIILRVAQGMMSRAEFADWVRSRMVEK